MLLGKRRARPSSCMKKTTSMTELTLDLSSSTTTNSSSSKSSTVDSRADQAYKLLHNVPLNDVGLSSSSSSSQEGGGDPDLLLRFLINSSSSSPPKSNRNQLIISRRHSADFRAAETTTAPFLRACNLCNRRLIPGHHDIYMYRGDSAFCSAECRQQEMTQDDQKKDKSSCNSSSTSRPPSNTQQEQQPSSSSSAGSKPKSLDTVAAAAF